MGMFKIPMLIFYIVWEIRDGNYKAALRESILLYLYIYGIDLYSFWPKTFFSIGFIILVGSISFTIFVFRLLYRISPDLKVFSPRVFDRWRLSREEWRPVTQSDQNVPLCDRCREWTSSSKLIMGSKRYFTRTDEVHGFHESLTDWYRHVNTGNPQCHLCCQLWYSIDYGIRQKIQEDPSEYSSVVLKIKLREERPFSKWTFVELIQDVKMLQEPRVVTTRLLVQREETNQIEVTSKASLSPSTDSPQHMEQAKEWLERCTLLHNCHEAIVVEEKPKRLVRVTSTTKGLHLKIEEYDASTKAPEYVAFSHCWGGSNSSLRLLKGKRLSFLEEIPFLELSKNIQDAVQITSRLGYSYIWIDSLCIIQDSEVDWSKESLKMGNVYAGAICTIASTGSGSGDGGCFHERKSLSLQPCKIGVRSINVESAGTIYIRQDDLLDFQSGVENAPLNQRGWVFQERLLSKRILHFGAEGLYWECHKRSASELNVNGYVYRTYPEDFDHQKTQHNSGKGEIKSQQVTEIRSRRLSTPGINLYDIKKPQTAWQKPRNAWKDIRKASDHGWEHDAEITGSRGFRAEFNVLQRRMYTDHRVGLKSFSHCWYEIVEPYTRGKLTFSSDKLIALSAIIQQIQQSTGYTFLAGLWKEHLVTDLLWFVLEKPGRRLTKTSSITWSDSDLTTSTTVAPTWSWASLEGTVGVDLVPKSYESKIHLQTILSEVIDGRFSHEFPNIRQKLAFTEGFLVLKGPILKVYGALSVYLLLDEEWKHIVRFVEDVERTEEPDTRELFCLPLIVIEHQTFFEKKEEIQGLVLTLRKKEIAGNRFRIFERVGFFTTYEMNVPEVTNKSLVEAEVETIYIV